MERMSHVDSAFLRLEDGIHHMHLASICVFEGPAPSYISIRSLVAGLLPRVPRYRQKVRWVPLDIQRPVWVDDEHFNIDYHIRHTALPTPGSDQQLRTLVGRLMSQQLDRTKPLWELWVVEDFQRDRWVLVSKVHHALVDGISGNDILTLMLVAEPDAPTPEVEGWNPQPEPSDLELAAEATRDLVSSPFEQYRAIQAGLRRPQRLAERATGAAQRFSALAPPDHGAGSLTGPIGPHRRWYATKVPLADVKRIRAARGGSVNDVVLAATAHGFHRLLLGRGEPVERRLVRTFVPVSVHTAGDTEEYDNTVSATFTDLPVGVEHATEALELITRQLEDLKESGQAVAGEVLTSLSGFSPPMLLSLGTRAATRAVGELEGVHTITTNVPGPQKTLYLLGRPMLEAYPYTPLRADMRLAVAVFSYNGNLYFGLTGDYNTTADLEQFCVGIREGFDELLAASPKAAETPAAT